MQEGKALTTFPAALSITTNGMRSFHVQSRFSRHRAMTVSAQPQGGLSAASASDEPARCRVCASSIRTMANFAVSEVLASRSADVPVRAHRSGRALEPRFCRVFPSICPPPRSGGNMRPMRPPTGKNEDQLFRPGRRVLRAEDQLPNQAHRPHACHCHTRRHTTPCPCVTRTSSAAASPGVLAHGTQATAATALAR